MDEITTIGIDLAKNVFQVHAVDASGAVVIRKALRRVQVVSFFRALPPCLVGKAKRQEAEKEIAQLEAETAAIAAYDAARKGKKPATATRAPRGPKGAKREAILSLIAQHPDGMTRAELLTAMSAHSDKAAEQSISNALAALKKSERVMQEGKKYVMQQPQAPL